MNAPQALSAKPVTRTQEHVGLIDYVRAVAILLVLGFHILIESFGNLQQMESRLSFTDGNLRHFFLAALPFSYGFMGVSIFFLVSGFCIHLSHARSKRQDYKAFFVRRFFRIYPPYFLALVFFAFVFPLTRIKLDSFISISQFLSHVLMVHNLDHRSFYGINGAFWSIGVEIQLYAIYPLLLLAARRLGWNKALLLTGGIEMSLRWLSSVVVLPYCISASPFSFWFSWAIGAKLADDHLNGRPLVLSNWPLWFWPCMVVLTYSVKSLFVFTFPCAALSTATVIAVFLSRPPVRTPLPRIFLTALSRIGVISYSLYLLHGPLFAFFPHQVRAAFPAHSFSPFEICMCLLLFCGVVMLLCQLYYRYVELPGIELGKWVLKRMPPKPAPAPESVTC